MCRFEEPPRSAIGVLARALEVPAMPFMYESQDHIVDPYDEHINEGVTLLNEYAEQSWEEAGRPRRHITVPPADQIRDLYALGLIPPDSAFEAQERNYYSDEVANARIEQNRINDLHRERLEENRDFQSQMRSAYEHSRRNAQRFRHHRPPHGRDHSPLNPSVNPIHLHQEGHGHAVLHDSRSNPSRSASPPDPLGAQQSASAQPPESSASELFLPANTLAYFPPPPNLTSFNANNHIRTNTIERDFAEFAASGYRPGDHHDNEHEDSEPVNLSELLPRSTLTANGIEVHFPTISSEQRLADFAAGGHETGNHHVNEDENTEFNYMDEDTIDDLLRDLPDSVESTIMDENQTDIEEEYTADGHLTDNHHDNTGSINPTEISINEPVPHSSDANESVPTDSDQMELPSVDEHAEDEMDGEMQDNGSVGEEEGPDSP